MNLDKRDDLIIIEKMSEQLQTCIYRTLANYTVLARSNKLTTYNKSI